MANKKVRVAINGLGRIGRAFTRLTSADPDIEIVAVNDLGDINNLAYLLKYDTAYGQFAGEIKVDGQSLSVGGKKMAVYQEKDPAKLPWKNLDVDVVLESTGFFESFVAAKAHVDAGAKKVVVSAPCKDKKELAPAPSETILMGINDEKLEGCSVSSNGSCTTNCAAPIVDILHKAIGIEKAVLNTVHAYTATQKVVDGPDAKDWRRGRAAAQNIVPSTTGAATAVTEVVSELAGKFDGLAMRVPVVTGSVVDLTFISKRETTRDEINDILKKASSDSKWDGIFTVTEEPVVSSDIVGDLHASIADLSFTKVVGGNLVKVLAWYDNEMGYTATLIKHIKKAGSFI